MSIDLLKSSLIFEQKDKKVTIGNIILNGTIYWFIQQFTLAFTITVSDLYNETQTKSEKASMDILVSQTDSIRGELNGAITGVVVANDNNFMLNPALNVRRAPSATRQIDVQANPAILTKLVKQTELSKATVRRETPLIQVLGRPIYPLKNNKLGKLKGIFLGECLIIFRLILKKITGFYK